MRPLIRKLFEFILPDGPQLSAPMECRPESPASISRFEQTHGVQLPQAYAGALLCTDFSLFLPLSNWCTPGEESEYPADFLTQEFPFTEAWNDRSSCSADDKTFRAPYFSEQLCTGAMRVVNTGCEGYVLLVVSGPCRGQFWQDDRVPFMTGVHPLLCDDDSRSTAENVVPQLIDYVRELFPHQRDSMTVAKWFSEQKPRELSP